MCIIAGGGPAALGGDGDGELEELTEARRRGVLKAAGGVPSTNGGAEGIVEPDTAGVAVDAVGYRIVDPVDPLRAVVADPVDAADSPRRRAGEIPVEIGTPPEKITGADEDMVDGADEELDADVEDDEDDEEDADLGADGEGDEELEVLTTEGEPPARVPNARVSKSKKSCGPIASRSLMSKLLFFFRTNSLIESLL